MCVFCAQVPSVSDGPLSTSWGLSSLGEANDPNLINEDQGDAASGTGTTYSLQFGEIFLGTVDSASDTDWVGVSLTAGRNYSLELIGDNAPPDGTLSDSILRLYDASGTLVAENLMAEAGLEFDNRLIFTATSSGTYYLEAAAANGETGTYALRARELPVQSVGTIAEMADYLINGAWTDLGDSARRWDTSSDNIITVNITGLNATEQQLARWSFEVWSAVADIRFEEVTTGADITYQNDDGVAGDPAAFAQTNVTNGFITSAIINIDSAWLDTEGSSFDSYGYQTYVHELGHAIGLGHMGPYNGNVSYPFELRFTNDSWLMSVMSYIQPSTNTTVPGTDGILLGPMMADILAVQTLYGTPSTVTSVTPGANVVNTTGDTTWGFGANMGGVIQAYWDDLAQSFTSNTSAGGQANVPINGSPNEMQGTIFDRDGIDTINLSGFAATTALEINLRPGSYSDVIGVASGFLSIAVGTIIENLVLGAASDTAYGNNFSNRIDMGDGANYAQGLNGWDTMIGGSGNDTLIGGNGRDRLFGNGGDDDLYGEAHEDMLSGGLGNDLLVGGAGNDSLWGAQGNDTIEGDEGDDRIGGDNGLDEIYGGAGNDTIFAGGWYDTVEGGTGNDVIYGGRGWDLLLGEEGNDSLLGEDGNDTLGGQDGDDTLSGGEGNDRVWGGTGHDRLIGNDGNDSLGGEAGRDTITGGRGDDMMWGGGWADTFVFFRGDGNDTIGDWSTQDLLILDSGLIGGQTVADFFDSGAVTVVNGNTVIDFGFGDTVTFLNFTDLDDLEAAITRLAPRGQEPEDLFV